MSSTVRVVLVACAVTASLLVAAPAADAGSARISGRVTLPGGVPAADFTVWIDTDTTSERSVVQTDALGRYTSDPLSTRHDWNVHTMVGRRDYGPQIRWDVDAGSTGVNFSLRSTGEQIRGRVLDQSGQPVKGLRVSAFDIGRNGPWTWNAATTDSRGYYAIKRLDPSERFSVFYGGSQTFVAVKAGRDTRLDLRTGQGYWVVTDRGVVHRFGSIEEFGDAKGFSQLVVSVAATPSGEGLWLLDEFGDVLTFGDARDYGSYRERRDRGIVGDAELVDIEPTRSGRGYFILDSAGGIHTFGDARFRGSIPGLRAKGLDIGLAKVAALAVTRSGQGYWVLDDNGGIFTFGDARFRGSIPGLRAKGLDIGLARVIGMAPTASGEGYWLADDNGGMFTFGDAVFKGSVPGLRLEGKPIGESPMVDMEPSAGGDGYFVVGTDGKVYAFGDATFQGDLPAKRAGGPAIGIAFPA